IARIHVIVVVGAIDVVDDGGIANKRVVDVHVTNVGAAAAIPRMKGFAPTEREPADTATETKAEAPVRATNEADKGRSIHWIGGVRPRPPPPAPANERPAAIVIGSKAPRLVADPRPAPRANPVPVAVAVRRPTGVDFGRIPDVPVVRNFVP